MIKENLTTKTIRPTDKIKVARVIADMLNVEKAESMTPEAAINTGLRKIKNKRMTPELIGVLKKMLNLAQDVGVKVDMSMIPKAVKEETFDEAVKVDTPTDYNLAKDILRLKDHMKLSKMNKTGQGIHPTPDMPAGEHPDDHTRRMKVKYKTEEADLDEQSIDYDTAAHKDKMEKRVDKANLILRHAKEREALATRHHSQKETIKEDDIETADYKTDKAGRKYRAHKIHVEEVDQAEFDILDLSDDELDALANQADFDDLIDVADEEDVAVVDSETGEVVDEMPVNEDHLMEVLSRSERMKARIRFMRTAAKRQRKMQIALKRRADPKTMGRRSRRMAIKLLKQKLMKKPASQLSVSEKERAERMIAARRGLIDRLALKLTPKLRKMETDRLQGHKSASPKVSV